MLQNVNLNRLGHLIIENLSDDNLGVYECHVKNKKNKIIKKIININFIHNIHPINDNKNNKLPPVVRIVPIHMDVREGGRIELECESGM